MSGYLIRIVAVVLLVGCGKSPGRPPGTTQVTPTAKPIADVPALVEQLVTSPAFVCINERFLAPDLDAHPDVIGAIGEAHARLGTEANPRDIAFSAPLKRRAYDSVRRIAKLDPSVAPTVTDLLDHGPKGAPDNILGAEYALYAGNHARATELLATEGPPKYDFHRHAAARAALGQWDQAVAFEQSFDARDIARAILEMSPYAQDPSLVRRAVQHYIDVLKAEGSDAIGTYVTIRRMRQLGYGAETRPLRVMLARDERTSELLLLQLEGELIAVGESVPSAMAKVIAGITETSSVILMRWRTDVMTKPVSELLTRLSTYHYEGNDLWAVLVRHIEAGLDPGVDARLAELCHQAKD